MSIEKAEHISDSSEWKTECVSSMFQVQRSSLQRLRSVLKAQGLQRHSLSKG